MAMAAHVAHAPPHDKLTDVAALEYIRALLRATPPNGAPPEAFGDDADLIRLLHEAHAAGGTLRLREAFRDYIHRHPEQADRFSGNPTQPAPTVRWTADELLVHQFPQIRWIVPGVFPEGLVMLAGRPKIGKSWLALQVAHAVSSGGQLFAQQIQQAPVLYLAFEDAARRLQKRMKAQAWPAYTQAIFCTAWAPLDRDGLDALHQDMAEEGYGLVIVDTLSRSLSGRPDQNSVGDMTVVLSRMQRLALDHQALFLVIDHHHKAQGVNPDPVDDILGSIAKGGVADAVGGLYRERGKRGATLHISGRDLDEDKRLALEWDGELSCWHYVGDADEVARASMQRAILEAVTVLGGRATTAEVAEHLDKDRGNISRSIAGLVQEGKLLPGKKEGKSQPYEIPGGAKGGAPDQED
jgi:AAA domain